MHGRRGYGGQNEQTVPGNHLGRLAMHILGDHPGDERRAIQPLEQPIGRVINGVIPGDFLALGEPVRRLLEIAFWKGLMAIEPPLTRISTKDF